MMVESYEYCRCPALRVVTVPEIRAFQARTAPGVARWSQTEMISASTDPLLA